MPPKIKSNLDTLLVLILKPTKAAHLWRKMEGKYKNSGKRKTLKHKDEDFPR